MASPIRAPLDIEPLGNIGGLLTPREDFVPNIQSVYGDIIQNAPDYQYFTAPLSNQGRTTATYGGQNNIVVAPDTPVRVVDNATGQVVYSGVGYEGAQGAIDAANALSASTGKKANWDIQVAGPTMQGFQSVSTDRPDVSGLGILADVALPVAAGFIPGVGPVLGAALGSAASSVAQGRSLEDTLKRAALSAGGAYVGGQVFQVPTDPLARSVETMANNAIANLGSSVAGTTAGSAVGSATGAAAGAAPSAIGDIVVTALGNIPAVAGGAFGSLAGSVVPSFFDAAQLNNIATVDQTPTAEQPSDYVVTAQVPTATTPAPTIPGILPPTTPTNIPSPNPAEDIVATAQTQTQPVTPTPVVLPPTTTTSNVPAPDPTEDIKVTAPKNTQVVTPPVIAPEFQPSPATTPKDTKPKDKVTDTISDVIKYAGTAGTIYDLINRLLGGGGDGTVPGTPYVSPFGAGTGTGVLPGVAGRTQVNPNIIDYERYGFGPEAAFFSGVQSGPATYKPLI